MRRGRPGRGGVHQRVYTGPRFNIGGDWPQGVSLGLLSHNCRRLGEVKSILCPFYSSKENESGFDTERHGEAELPVISKFEQYRQHLYCLLSLPSRKGRCPNIRES